MLKSWKIALFATALATVSACKTAQDEGATTTGDTTVEDGGSGTFGDGGTTDGTSTVGDGGTSIPALVSVNLENVLNDLSVSLNVEEANIPVNAQVPIEVAANVCGVSVNALGASIASGQVGGCTATTTSPELIQVVQQQVSAGGDVEGGDQTTTVPDPDGG